jgi:hypothetical protein
MNPLLIRLLYVFAGLLCLAAVKFLALPPDQVLLVVGAGMGLIGMAMKTPGAEVMGKAAAEAEAAKTKADNANPPPWHPRGGGGAAALLVAVVLALGGGTGCSSGLPAVASKVGKASKVVVPMSKDALKLLRLERDRLVAEKLLTGTAAADVDAALLKAETVLGRVERKEKVTREELLKAIEAATLVNDLLIAAGGKPPPLVASAIDVARRVVDEAE